MNDSILRSLIEWARPRANWKWVVIGQASPELVQVLIETAKASAVTLVAETEQSADALRPNIDGARVTVQVDDYASMRNFSGTVDVALDLGALNGVPEPPRVVSNLARVTRLYGIVLAIEPGTIARRTLWDWWLDARLNDVVSREEDGFSMVRGTR